MLINVLKKPIPQSVWNQAPSGKGLINKSGKLPTFSSSGIFFKVSIASLHPGACLGISVFQPSLSRSLFKWYIQSSFSGTVYMNTIVRYSSDLQPITTQCRILTYLRYIAVENTVRKEEIACNKQFLLFLPCFLPYTALIFDFKCTSKCRLQFDSIWPSLKFCRPVLG